MNAFLGDAFLGRSCALSFLHWMPFVFQRGNRLTEAIHFIDDLVQKIGCNQVARPYPFDRQSLAPPFAAAQNSKQALVEASACMVLGYGTPKVFMNSRV